MVEGIPTQMLQAIVPYAFALLGGGLFIHLIIECMWRLVEAEAILENPLFATAIHASLRRYEWQGDVLGIVERTLYLASIQAMHPEFIAVWLTLKTIARSSRWTEEKRVRGRALFNNFVAGNGLSILYAGTAAGMIEWAKAPEWTGDRGLALWVPVALSLGSIALLAFLAAVRFARDQELRRRLSPEAYEAIHERLPAQLDP